MSFPVVFHPAQNRLYSFAVLDWARFHISSLRMIVSPSPVVGFARPRRESHHLAPSARCRALGWWVVSVPSAGSGGLAVHNPKSLHESLECQSPRHWFTQGPLRQMGRLHGWADSPVTVPDPDMASLPSDVPRFGRCRTCTGRQFQQQ